MTKDIFLEKVSHNVDYEYFINNDVIKSHDLITIKCKEHNTIFEQKVYVHLAGSTGCKYCSLNKIKSKNKLKVEEFIKRSNKIHKNYYDYSKVVFIDTKTKVNVVCPEHGDFYPIPSNHMNGSKCPKCAFIIKNDNQKLKFDEFIKRASKLFNNKYNYIDDNFDYKKNMKCECKKHGIFNLNPERHITRLSECPKCIEERNKISLDEFIMKSNIIHDNKYDYSLVNFETLKDKIEIICPKHGRFIQYATHHIHNKKGCKYCTREKSINTYLLNFIKDCNIIHNSKYDYSKINLTKLKNKIEIICPIHGSFFKRPYEHLNKKSGCQLCKSSKGEKKIRSFLIKNRIKFDEQKKFKECKNVRELPFDFYLPKLNICIEYDGEQHYNAIEIWGGDDRLNNIKSNDSIKNYFCTQNNIKLIRIPYKDYDNIDTILTENILNCKNNIKLDILRQKLDIVNDYKYKYNFNNYINVNSQIDITCPLHGLNIKTAYKALQGNACSNCDDSKGEREISKYLDRNGISYYRQHKFSNCKNIYPLGFDFYIPSMRTVIEFGGIQHFQPVTYFGGLEAYERLKINDKIKEDYCEENYINIIRIKYDQIDNIYQILWKNLKGFIKN